MEFITSLLDTFSYLEKHMESLFFSHGRLTYLVLSLVIFCETAFVVTSFLPGDSLLLAAGVIAAGGSLDIRYLLLFLSLAAIAGNIAGYWMGYAVGARAFEKESKGLFNRENLMKAHGFYEKYGAVTIILSRFVAFVRAFAPFIAGIARMDFRHFMLFNVVGSVAWVFVFCLGGMFFGRIPFFEDNTLFTVFLIILFALVLLPLFLYILRKMTKKKKPGK